MFSFADVLKSCATEYSPQVNQFNIRDNLLHLRGQSSSNVTHKRVKAGLSENVFISEEYGQEACSMLVEHWMSKEL